MLEPVSVGLKFAFLIVLYLFLLWVARSSLRDMTRNQDASIVADAPPPGGREQRRRAGADLRAGVQPRLEVVAAMGLEPGHAFDVSEGATMGRADGSDIEIDDPFASSVHSRIFPRGQFMYIEDMGSTNGTYLNEEILAGPQPLHAGDRVRIGDSEFTYVAH